MKDKIKKTLLCMVLSALCAAFFGCGLVSGKANAEKVVEVFLQKRINDGGLEADKAYYSTIFWENTTEEDWGRLKLLVSKALGDLKTYSLNSWNVNSNYHTNELSGTFVVLVYDMEYEKGSGQEVLTMHKGVGEEDYLILGHRINSPLIQELLMQGIEQVTGGGSE